MNESLHMQLYPTRTTALTERFVRELLDKHHLEDAEFLVDRGPWLHAALHRIGCDFVGKPPEDGTP